MKRQTSHRARTRGGWILLTVLALGFGLLSPVAAPAEVPHNAVVADVMGFVDPNTGLWYLDKDSTPFYYGNPGESPS